MYRKERNFMEKAKELVYNEETRKAIEDARRGIGLTKGYHSAEELFAALDAEEEDEETESVDS